MLGVPKTICEFESPWPDLDFVLPREKGHIRPSPLTFLLNPGGESSREDLVSGGDTTSKLESGRVSRQVRTPGRIFLVERVDLHCREGGNKSDNWEMSYKNEKALRKGLTKRWGGRVLAATSTLENNFKEQCTVRKGFDPVDTPVQGLQSCVTKHVS